MNKPLVSIIILSWNTKELLAECLEAIYKYKRALEFEVLVVDNGSSDGSQDMIELQFPQARLIRNHENLGFAKANNQAVQMCESPFVLLLNSDAILSEGALEALVHTAEEKPKAAIVGALLKNPDGSFQASYSSFPSFMQEFMILSGLGRLVRGRWYPSKGPEEQGGPKRVDYIEGACMLVRREAIDSVGGLSEDFFMYAEEVDWCLRMKKGGWEVWYQPEARVKHYGGASSRNRKTAREGDLYYSRVLLFLKHRGRLQARLLKWMMIFLTMLKYTTHSVLRLFSGGKAGRLVISPITLTKKLREF